MMHAVAQVYYMDRKTRQLSTHHWFTNEQAVLEIEKWIAHGAIALVAVDTPYGSGTAVVRNNPELMVYLKTNFREVAINERYMIYSLR